VFLINSRQGDYVQICGEWDNSSDLRSALRFNLYGLLLLRVSVKLDNILLPTTTDFSTSLFRAFKEGGKKLELFYDAVTEVAELHNDGMGYAWNDGCEKLMLDTVARVQAVSRATKAAKTLIMAYRGTDRGYIDRATKQLFEDIGGML
jgi:hypothetical protein